jgi:hypothetical protein
MRAPRWLTERLARPEPRVFAQGDVVLLRVADADGSHPPAQQPVILAEGEHTGHLHAFYGDASLYRDRQQAADIPEALYIGHVEISARGAVLEHGPGPGRRGDHDPLTIPPGLCVAVRQREYVEPRPGDVRRGELDPRRWPASFRRVAD